MTKLTKKVQRACPELTRRGLVITMYPGGILGFRESRMRKEYTLPAMTCYKLAIQAEQIAKREAKKKGQRK